MINLLLNHQCNSNYQNLFRYWKRVLFIGTLFLFSLSPFAQTPIQIHIYDTGFCPNLIKVPKNVLIKPVVDVTQKNKYHCEEKNLKSVRFHGQWVLSTILKNLKESSQTTIEVTPIIIFDDLGNQSLSFWKRAFEYSKEKKADTIFAAAGFPLPDQKTIKKSAEIRIPQIPLFLAAGRMGKSLQKETLLFPQVHENKKNVYLIGSYFEGIKGAGSHFHDPQLMHPKTIDFYFPFKKEDSEYKELKGTSYALAAMGNFFVKNCLKKELESCLSAHKSLILLEKKKEKTKVYTLK